jgi:uncharacterized protein YifE (UPF0438 family)
MVEQLYSLDVVDDFHRDKVGGLDVLEAHMHDDLVIFDNEMFDDKVMKFDDDEMKKRDDDVVKEKRFVLVYDKDDDKAASGDKQPRKRKRVRKRKKRFYKKKKMAPPMLGGAPCLSSHPGDPGAILLTSATTARWRVLGHHVRGDGDARSESAPSSGMVSFPSFSFIA